MEKITFWNGLATADLERTRGFYTALGFKVGDMPGGGGITVRPSESSLICFVNTELFADWVPGAVCDTARAHEIIHSVSADSRAGVDDLAARAKGAGGRILEEPTEKPYGYVCGFADPDGHLWSVLWMPSEG